MEIEKIELLRLITSQVGILSLSSLILWILSLSASHNRKRERAFIYMSWLFVLMVVQICPLIFDLGEALASKGLGSEQQLIYSFWELIWGFAYNGALLASAFAWLLVKNRVLDCWKVILPVILGELLVFGFSWALLLQAICAK